MHTAKTCDALSVTLMPGKSYESDSVMLKESQSEATKKIVAILSTLQTDVDFEVRHIATVTLTKFE